MYSEINTRAGGRYVFFFKWRPFSSLFFRELDDKSEAFTGEKSGKQKKKKRSETRAGTAIDVIQSRGGSVSGEPIISLFAIRPDIRAEASAGPKKTKVTKKNNNDVGIASSRTSHRKHTAPVRRHRFLRQETKKTG